MLGSYGCAAHPSAGRFLRLPSRRRYPESAFDLVPGDVATLGTAMKVLDSIRNSSLEHGMRL